MSLVFHETLQNQQRDFKQGSVFINISLGAAGKQGWRATTRDMENSNKQGQELAGKGREREANCSLRHAGQLCATRQSSPYLETDAHASGEAALWG